MAMQDGCDEEAATTKFQQLECGRTEWKQRGLGSKSADHFRQDLTVQCTLYSVQSHRSLQPKAASLAAARHCVTLSVWRPNCAKFELRGHVVASCTAFASARREGFFSSNFDFER
mgnify:CR=1 FL=1